MSKSGQMIALLEVSLDIFHLLSKHEVVILYLYLTASLQYSLSLVDKMDELGALMRTQQEYQAETWLQEQF